MHPMESYSAMKRNEIFIHATTLVNPPNNVEWKTKKKLDQIMDKKNRPKKKKKEYILYDCIYVKFYKI